MKQGKLLGIRDLDSRIPFDIVQPVGIIDMKKADKSAATRNIILDAAARCFAEKGYSACSMQEIAECSGVSKGAIYGHFSGKEELFRTIINLQHDYGAEKASQMAQGQSYVQAIIDFMAECIRDSGFPIDHRLWAEVLAVAARDEDMKKAFLESEKKARHFFKSLIEKGIEAGEIDDSVDVEGMSIVLFALGDGLISRIADDPEFDFQKHFKVFKLVVEGALKKRG